MLAAERHARIISSLRTTMAASTDDLARGLDVSAETIRRDLVILEQKGMLTRIRGGATTGFPFTTGEEPAFGVRTSLATEAKTRIGRAAATLVTSGTTLVIDVGTTALALARALPAEFTGTIATCSLVAAIELAERPHLEVLISGGALRSGDLALSNSLTVGFFADIYSDIAFLGSGGVDADAGLTDFYFDEAAARKVMIANASQSYILADSTKLGRIARHGVAPLGQVSGLVTDEEPTAAIRDAVEAGGGRVIVAP